MALKLIRRCVLAAATLWAIYYLYYSTDWSGILVIVARSNFFMILMMMLAWFLLLILRPLRLSILFSAVDPNVKLPYFQILIANLNATAANNFLPAKAGDFFIPLTLRKNGLQARKSVPILFIEKLIDLFLVLLVFLISILLSPVLPFWAKKASQLGVAVLCFSLLILMVIIWKKVFFANFIHKIFKHLLPGKTEIFVITISDSLDALEFLLKSRKIILFVFISASMSIVTIYFYYFGLRSLLENVPFNMACFTMGAVALSFLIPLTPGGIGIFHTVVAASLALFGVDFDRALAFALLAHGLPLLTITVLVALIIFIQKSSFTSRI